MQHPVARLGRQVSVSKVTGVSSRPKLNIRSGQSLYAGRATSSGWFHLHLSGRAVHMSGGIFRIGMALEMPWMSGDGANAA
jgi:hypothetical protein